MVFVFFVFFKELESIPEGIEDVHAIESCERLVRHWRKAGLSTSVGEFGEAVHEDRRVRFAGCVEVTVYAEMQAQSAGSEPRTAACGKIRRFGFFD